MGRAGVNGLWCRDRHVTQPPDDEVINMLVRRDGIPTWPRWTNSVGVRSSA